MAPRSSDARVQSYGVQSYGVQYLAALRPVPAGSGYPRRPYERQQGGRPLGPLRELREPEKKSPGVSKQERNRARGHT